MTISKATIKDEIIKGKTQKALKQLLKLTETFDPDFHNQAIMLSGRFNSLAKDKRMGIISSQEAIRNQNRIGYHLTQLLTEIPEEWKIEGEETTTKTNKPQPKPEKKTILFLAANPKDTTPLRLGEEIRKIDNGLQRGKNRDSFTLVQKHAVTVGDFRRALLNKEPNIVHFSGHGSKAGRIILEDENGGRKEIPPSALGGLFELFQDHIECVLLNACYSESQAQEIAKYIPHVVGMSEAISDKAAIA